MRPDTAHSAKRVLAFLYQYKATTSAQLFQLGSVTQKIQPPPHNYTKPQQTNHTSLFDCNKRCYLVSFPDPARPGGRTSSKNHMKKYS